MMLREISNDIERSHTIHVKSWWVLCVKTKSYTQLQDYNISRLTSRTREHSEHMWIYYENHNHCYIRSNILSPQKHTHNPWSTSAQHLNLSCIITMTHVINIFHLFQSRASSIKHIPPASVPCLLPKYCPSCTSPVPPA
jgi:hypothetical protein